MSGNSDNRNSNNPRWTAKRIIALIAVILLAAMYVVTLIAAITSSPSTPGLFRFCLGMTIAVPIFSWIAIYAAGYLTHRHTIASADILNSNTKERKRMEDAVARQMDQKEKEHEDAPRTSDKDTAEGAPGTLDEDSGTDNKNSKKVSQGKKKKHPGNRR